MTLKKRARPIAIDFFAGAGGLSLGLEQAGFDVVLAVDRDGYHTATHERNFPYGKSICASVTELTGNKIREILGSDEDIDLVCGGPPCQGFSHMGTRDLGDPRNTLVDEYVRLVLELRPKGFIMENVPGMQSGATARIFERAVAAFEEGGYAITRPVKTLNAMDFGVPQRRERLFLLGVRSEFRRTVQYPHGPVTGQAARPTVWEAISDLPSGDRLGGDGGDEVLYAAGHQPKHPYAAVARGVQDDPSDYSHPRHWDRTRCTGCQAVRHRPDIAALYAATVPGTMVPGHKLPRLDANGLAPTLRAGSESEHGSYTAPRPVHPREPRCITAREAARLHGYPDWFRFYPGKWHAYRQIGNSVCPPVARALGRQFLAAFGFGPRRVSGGIQLASTFNLPAERPKQHRRITQTEEWPKILKHLWAAATDDRGRLVRPTFTVRDVEVAYAATAAKMPRNPARRFLADIARSRNVKKLLKPLLDRGYSIREDGNDGVYGRFVAAGTPGCLDDKDILTVSSAEIAEATRLEPLGGAVLRDLSIVRYLELAAVARPLLGAESIKVDGPRDLLGDLSPSGQLRFRAMGKSGCRRKGLLLLAPKANLPRVSHVSGQLHQAGEDAAIVVSAITSRHFAAFLLRLTDYGRASVERHRVFHVTD